MFTKRCALRHMISLGASENMAADLTIADVYEDASLIGQDIEKVIERFGHDAVVDFMPKVICVLEKLELVIGEREKDKLEIAELKLENERLYLDIKREACQRRKLDEELYQISSSGESDNLKSMLVKLQEENRKLRLEYEVSASNQPVTAYISAPGDAELMHKMKETIDNQRDTIRNKNQEIKSQRNDMEAIEEQIERLTSINQNIRRSLASSQERITLLAKEKAELQTELRAFRRTSQQELENDDENSENENSTDSDLELEQYGKTLANEIEKEATQKYEDEYTEIEESPSMDQNPPPKPPRLHLENQDKEEHSESVNNNTNLLINEERTAKRIQENGSDVSNQEEGDWEIVESQNPSIKVEDKPVERTGKGKEERDKQDPNRPRYTKAELLEILIERNKLKERVWALQEELAIYKPSDLQGEESSNLRRNSMSPRRETRKEESGISRIFHIFARKGES